MEGKETLPWESWCLLLVLLQFVKLKRFFRLETEQKRITFDCFSVVVIHHFYSSSCAPKLHLILASSANFQLRPFTCAESILSRSSKPSLTNFFFSTWRSAPFEMKIGSLQQALYECVLLNFEPTYITLFLRFCLFRRHRFLSYFSPFSESALILLYHQWLSFSRFHAFIDSPALRASIFLWTRNWCNHQHWRRWKRTECRSLLLKKTENQSFGGSATVGWGGSAFRWYCGDEVLMNLHVGMVRRF